jgi:hypothetical protein
VFSFDESHVFSFVIKKSFLVLPQAAVLSGLPFFFVRFRSLSRSGKEQKMKNLKKEKIVEKFPGKKAGQSEDCFNLPEKRLRFVDFRRIEENRNEEGLSAYELEVKEKLASVPSPYDELVRVEEEEELAQKERSDQIKLGLLARKAKMSPQERACYRLLYVEKHPEPKVKKMLGISKSHLSHLKSGIEQAMRKACQASSQTGKRACAS